MINIHNGSVFYSDSAIITRTHTFRFFIIYIYTFIYLSNSTSIYFFFVFLKLTQTGREKFAQKTREHIGNRMRQ